MLTDRPPSQNSECLARRSLADTADDPAKLSDKRDRASALYLRRRRRSDHPLHPARIAGTEFKGTASMYQTLVAAQSLMERYVRYKRVVPLLSALCYWPLSRCRPLIRGMVT